MKELNSNPEVADVRDNNLKDCCKSSDTPFTRIVEEKRALDEKIVKLNAFLEDEEKAARLLAIGSSDKCANSLTSCCGIRAF